MALRFFPVILAAAIVASNVIAAEYPSRPIRVIVPFTPGSATDMIARMVGPKMTESWGQQIVVDNRPSAGGTVAGGIVAGSAPDGYTIMLTSSTGAMPKPTTPEAFDKMVRAEIITRGKIFKAAGAKAE